MLVASRIKGSHAAIKSGMLAPKPPPRSPPAAPTTLSDYPEAFRESWLYEELHTARNFKPWMAKGPVDRHADVRHRPGAAARQGAVDPAQHGRPPEAEAGRRMQARSPTRSPTAC
jgi:flavin-dependent dehydrogenase